MMSARRIFVDTNVLIRATVSAAPLHAEARTTLDRLWEEQNALFISHQVVREYVANVTRPQNYSPSLPIDQVLGQVLDFRKSFHILPDSPEVLSKFLDLVSKITVGGKQVHDANVVATMLANHIEELLTNNTIDFERYKPLIQLIPLVATP